MSLELLYVTSAVSWGGLEMNILRLARKMSEKGYNVSIACNYEGRLYQEIRKSQSENGSQINIIELGSGFFENFRKLCDVLKRRNFDVVHIFRSHDVKLISLVSFWLGKNINAIFEPQIGIGSNKKDLFHRFIYKKIKFVIAPSRDVANGFLKNLPVGKEKVRIIHLGIDVDKFKFREDRREKIRKEFGFKDEVVIGIVSRFSPGKGHEDLFKAFKILSEEIKNVKLLIVGEPTVGELNYAKKLQELEKELGIEDKTVWTGFRRDINDILCGVDIFVAPSHAEAFGLSLVEAMATELPVVATKSAGFLDIISDGENGLFFEKGNYQDLAEKIKFLINNQELAKQLGKKARETAREKFSFEKYISEIENLYFNLTEAKQTEVSDVQYS
ncbi:MAG: glycosyltransferase family 4 protein [Candidatus Kryptonium sp.]|nr:glycosyltransferase family 4 protein [Candidatus Kryptonium sp.]MCX7762393.1 glycosyltransferase family 4 protein [Candidatus Kryptonium sp.]MDW8109818.1 glycosyltransferase family 4 protein [Candidatus Kryptonium sp.]